MKKINYSLLVPSYNRPSLIRETVLSLKANLAPDVEIVISDDASPRESDIRSALSSLIDGESIRYSRQSKNGGWSQNRNALIRSARGEYVILLGDDDRLKDGAIDRLRQWMKAHPAMDIYGLGYDVIDADGAYMYSRTSPKAVTYEIGKAGWKELFYFDALPMWSHHPFTMCFRRSLGLTLPYNHLVGVADDILFLFEALQEGARFFVIPESLFEWRKVLQSSRGYLNISSEGTKSAEGKRLVWLAVLRNPNTKTEVRKLLSSQLGIRRFLGVSLETARRIERQVDNYVSGELGVTCPFLDPRMSEKDGLARKCLKTIRVLRVLGARHAFNIIRHVVDRYKYSVREKRNANE